MPNAINVAGGANNLTVAPAVRNVQLILDTGRAGPPGLSNPTHLFIYKDNLGQPPTPTGGSWNGVITLVPPTGWLTTPPSSVLYSIWSSDVYVTGIVPSITTWSTPGTYSGVGQSLGLQVDGADVPSLGGKVNFIDSVATTNRIMASNLTTNQVSFNVDQSSPLNTASLKLLNNSLAQGITLDYPATATTDYTVFLPPSQGAVGQTLINDGLGNLSWQTISGGGGGALTATSRWTTSGAATKNAFISPGIPNSDGITIALTASTGTGSPTSCRVTLNGVLLPNTYSATGLFPAYIVTVPVIDLSGNPAQTAASVMVGISGTFAGSMFNSSAGTLNNTQPVPFATTLSGFYGVAQVPFYTTSAQLNYSYTNSNAITSFAGVFTPGGNATSPSGAFPSVPITGSVISGTATGSGLNGAGSNTVTLSGSVGAVPTYTPAFYVQTANASVPGFGIGSTQTPGSQINATIVYPAATATTQYDWVATTQPIGRVFIVTPLGNAQLVPDVTATTVIATVTFNVFGFTSLVVGNAARILITA